VEIGKIELLIHQWLRLRCSLYTLLIGGQFQHLGRKSKVMPPFRFYGLNQMSLGNHVFIERNCWIQTIGEPTKPGEVKLAIGDYTSIGMGSSISAAARIDIGEYVLLARNVYIADHAHAFEDVNVPIMRQGINQLKPVSIGSNTWLGQNVSVLPGVAIGRHCVVGANSVVNASVPDFCVAVGAPARVVKRYNAETKNWERVKAG
jgi:acetyltransferase-like isoleucine patch superfamily enzyme